MTRRSCACRRSPRCPAQVPLALAGDLLHARVRSGHLRPQGTGSAWHSRSRRYGSHGYRRHRTN